MNPPAFRTLLGRSASSAETLFDYGYRAAWKVTAGTETFMVKADDRPGHTANEVDAQRHARDGGVPVPEIVGFDGTTPASFAMLWATGEPLHAESTPAARRNVGQSLRHLHSLPVLRQRESPLAKWLCAWLADETAYMAEQAVISLADRQSALAACARLRPMLESTPLAWIHGDCQCAHFLIDPESERVTAVLDWADAQHGAPEMDLAVLTLFDAASLPDILDGYEATDELRGRLALPLYHAARGAGSFRWLETHHPEKRTFAVERVTALARMA